MAQFNFYVKVFLFFINLICRKSLSLSFLEIEVFFFGWGTLKYVELENKIIKQLFTVYMEHECDHSFSPILVKLAWSHPNIQTVDYLIKQVANIIDEMCVLTIPSPSLAQLYF